MTASDERAFRKFAAITAVLSTPVAYVAEWFGFTAINFDPTVFSDPSVLIALGPEAATLIWWGMRLNIFGYYLLVAPAVVFLWYWLRPKSPLFVGLLTIGGLAYVFFGALGATINAVVWPDIMVEYAGADPGEHAVLEAVFSPFATTVGTGVWGILNRIVSAVWWIGIGVLLSGERRWLGRFTIVLGGFSAIAAVGNLLVVMPLTSLGTTGFLVLAPLWALWLGVDLWRQPGGSFEVESAEFGASRIVGNRP